MALTWPRGLGILRQNKLCNFWRIKAIEWTHKRKNSHYISMIR
ncbi:hypothetical protein D1AOALGA4SA_85 [Olavius algarvensis Delta 1 endosymbiont]|nr:hypothetical protein D1AOALGA4SA_85 [Olavius algarvensis Delta 1 endosymbiont]